MVSIIVTHKKDVLYLRDCLESIAEQQFKDYETVLVLDHTEDDLSKLIAEFQDKINLKVYELQDKTGVSAARNLGIDKSEGEYIYFLDNDDYLCGESIAKLLDVMDADTDMAYGTIKHTWFQRQAFNESQGDDEDNEYLLQFDFNEPVEYRFEKYRRLEKLTVLGAVYRKSLFADNNIRFNENQTYVADPLVVTATLRYAKNIRGNEEAVYVKRNHNDKQNNPALSQFTREETMPDYFVAYKNSIKMAGDNKRLKNQLNVILAKFIVKEYIKKLRWSDDERWKNEYFEGLAELAKSINKRALSGYGIFICRNAKRNGSKTYSGSGL